MSRIPPLGPNDLDESQHRLYTAIISGRSDATINRGGIRMGTAEIYRAVMAVDAVTEHSSPLMGDRAVQLVGGVGEQLDAVLDQFGRDRIERDAGFFQFGQYALGNLLYTPVTNAMVGGELQWGRRTNFSDGFSSDGLKLQFSFKYNFSYKIGG